jgi:hypothetical protein
MFFKRIHRLLKCDFTRKHERYATINYSQFIARFPIAKIAAKRAVGSLLDELKNDITRETLTSFELSIDYVVTKIPRFAFEKFPQADPTPTTQMISVGEAMAIGRTFKESLQKCLRSLEIGRSGLGGDGKLTVTGLVPARPTWSGHFDQPVFVHSCAASKC